MPGLLKRKLLVKFLSLRYLLIFAICLVITAWLVMVEVRRSILQSRSLSDLAASFTTRVVAGESPAVRFPGDGPYDLRLGYSRLPKFVEHLKAENFVVERQARISPQHLEWIDRGIFPIYREKSRAGIEILDDTGRQVYRAQYPERAYADFNAIPAVVVRSLLFIENRELLTPVAPTQNPAIEWDRFAKALLDLGLSKVTRGQKPPGASTLPTQIEKFRHSPSGLTSGPGEKLRQMITASIRSYLDGADTTAVRTRVILDYVNSIPLSAVPDYGEVNGLGDGLWAWFGADFAESNRLLSLTGEMTPAESAAKALAYKQVLALFVAQRRPSYYLRRNPEGLNRLTDRHLRLMAANGIIDPALQAAAEKITLSVLRRPDMPKSYSFTVRKAANAVRTSIMEMLHLDNLYELDRIDLTAQSTLDLEIQQKAGAVLKQLEDPKFLAKAGLTGERLLSMSNDPKKIVYSLTLFEHTPSANLLRVQTDNLDQPFNVNEGVKLDLGSTAKLRTLITYLEMIQDLHERYAGLSAAELKKVELHRADKLTRWGLEYLAAAKDKALGPMLAAAMQRTYSANPGEVFFTGGGQHVFQNFKKEDDVRVLTVQEGLRHSVNLVFIRLMRDIVNYLIYGAVDSPGRMLEDRSDARRQEYLERFADKEGGVFMKHFYRKYRGKNPDEALALLMRQVKPTPRRLAAVYRALDPSASLEDLRAFLSTRLPDESMPPQALEALYRGLDRAVTNLADRGYIARVHPLELWLVAFLRKHPQADLKEVLGASHQARIEVYTWLYKSRFKGAQNTRLRIVLEAEAFTEMHRLWQRLGYPFDFLVPSYATSIGSSGDRPSALAELLGIIQSGGVHYPAAAVETLHFAKDTPFETELAFLPPPPERVLSAEVASVVKTALRDVVERGTAVRVNNAFKGVDGKPIPIGGKTGTGDHRYEVYGPGGRLISSKVLNRTATFAFYIGDRFFGTVVAFVAGPEAADYHFTSALPAQLLKVLSPELTPLINRPPPK